MHVCESFCMHYSRERVQKRIVCGGAVAWDCHMHVFGEAATHQVAAVAEYVPPPAPLRDYLAVRSRLGCTRSVIVQPSVYAADNRLLYEVLEARPDFRGVVTIDRPLDVHAARALAARGVRGVRINLVQRGGGDANPVLASAAAMARAGLHAQVVAAPERGLALGARLVAAGLTVVFDHFGFIRPGAESLGRLVALLEGGSVWVKLSAAYRLSATGLPHYGDMGGIARTLAAARPDRLVWGSDWPHPQCDAPRPADPAGLAAALETWIADPRTVRDIRTANPERLYA